MRISGWSSDVCSSDLVNVDAQLVDQPLVIKLRPARPHEQRAAHRVHPDLARLRREPIARIGIGGGISEHRLAARAPAAQRVAPPAQFGRITALEMTETADDRLNLVIVLRGLYRAAEHPQPAPPPHPPP